MGLALHCHGELKLKNGRDERERDTKRKMELFPQALALLQALQMCSSCLQNAKDTFPSRKQKKKGKLDTSAKIVAWRKPLTARRKPPNSAETLRVPPGDLQMPPGASHQTVLKPCVYRPAISRCRQAVSCWKGHFSPGWRQAPGTGRRCRLAVSLWRQAITVSSPFSVFLPSSCYS